jgi:hypothetical protein
MTHVQEGGDLRATADAEVAGQLFEWVLGKGVNRGELAEILKHLERQPGRSSRSAQDHSTA